MKLKLIQNNLCEMLGESTSYGLPRIFKSKRIFFKFFWLLFFIMGFIASFYFVIEATNNYLKYDGFVVLMGTDTMAYASSAVSFMLENLGKTVVFTGSQIPFCEVYNDARRNLIVSLIFAAASEIPEVCICFNDSLLRANRTVKVDSGSLAAFMSPNFPPLPSLVVSMQS
jgi:hypothetical protein